MSCEHKNLVRFGYQKRKTTGEKIQRYRCKDCSSVILNKELIKNKRPRKQAV